MTDHTLAAVTTKPSQDVCGFVSISCISHTVFRKKLLTPNCDVVVGEGTGCFMFL